jgi:hypothetical protein
MNGLTITLEPFPALVVVDHGGKLFDQIVHVVGAAINDAPMERAARLVRTMPPP